MLECVPAATCLRDHVHSLSPLGARPIQICQIQTCSMLQHSEFLHFPDNFSKTCTPGIRSRLHKLDFWCLTDVHCISKTWYLKSKWWPSSNPPGSPSSFACFCKNRCYDDLASSSSYSWTGSVITNNSIIIGHFFLSLKQQKSATIHRWLADVAVTAFS